MFEKVVTELGELAVAWKWNGQRNGLRSLDFIEHELDEMAITTRLIKPDADVHGGIEKRTQ